MKPTLLILAAGIGSRYGGLKQLDPIGPGGEVILDYSIYDALRAGFGKVVFVVRKSIAEAVRSFFEPRLPETLEVRYVYQELDALPAGFTVPAGREKPWGTGHAVLVAAPEIHEPFAVINADDFYGRDAFERVGRFLTELADPGANEYALIAYRLGNTLSEHGSVSRGVCSVDEHGFLTQITEHLEITRTDDGIVYRDEAGTLKPIAADTLVSMNLLGFTPTLFRYLDDHFRPFLEKHAGNLKAEFLLPEVLNALIHAGEVRVRVLETRARWFGVTYREDKASAEQRLRELIARGAYPQALWKR